jgi:dUTP pyrophosphatase
MRVSDWFLRKVLRQKVRGFAVVAEWARKVPEAFVTLPTRSTQGAAAYDIYALESKTIRPGGKVEFPTDVKVYMRDDEVFHLYPRSNQGIKFDLMLANTTGVIDADYYENPDNDGAFTIVLRNLGYENYYVKAGDRIAQGEFAKFLLADNDYNKKLPKRKGGVGSTGGFQKHG